MRKVGIAVVIIVVLVIVAAAVLPQFLDVNRYRGRIQAQVEQRLNRPVSLGKLHLSLLPPAFRAEKPVISEDKNFSTGKPFAEADELYATAALGPLFHGNVELKSVELRRPRIELIRNQQGTWNFASLGHNAVAPTTPPPAAAQNPAQKQQANQQRQLEQATTQQAQKQQHAFSLDHFIITDGQVALTDLQKHQSRAVYDHIDLDLKNYAPAKPFTFSLAAHLPGRGKQTVQLKGEAGPIAEGSLLQTPFRGLLKLEQVSLAGAQKFLNTQALANTDAVISGATEIKNQNGKIASSGSLTLNQARVRGVDIGYPISADYDVADDLTTDVINIQKGNFKLGPTPVALSGTLNTRLTPSQLDVRLQASNASIAEAARLAAAFGAAFNPGMDVKGNINADIRAKGPANRPAMDGKLSARDLVITGKELPQPVKVNAIELALSPQNVTSNDFTASTGGTNLSVRFGLSNYTTANPAIDAALRTANANLGEVLNIAKAYGVAAVNGVTGSGTLSLDLHATGPIKNSSAMNFAGTGKLQNASLKTPSVKQPLQVHNTDLRFTQNSVMLQNVSASIGQSNASGMLTLKNFAAPQVQFALSADKVNVTELQELTAPPAAQKRASASLVPQAVAAAEEQSILTKASGSGTIQIGTVLYDQLILNQVKSNVVLDHGIIRLAPITAELYGGQENGSIIVDARKTPISFNLTSSLQKVDANKLISSVSPVKQMLYGMLAANARSSFSAVPSGNIASTLNGKLFINLTNGRLMRMDLLHELASIGKFVGVGQAAQGFTNVASLTGNLDFTNGVAHTNDLKAVIDGGTLAANGLVSLVDQSLNLHLIAVLSKDFSAKVGGTGIGGFMNTALANNRGELVVPVIVTGTFQQPHFAPDIEKVAQMKMQNLVPSLNNPGDLTTGILGSVLGNGQNAGQGQAGAAGGLTGILGTLGNRGKTQGQQPPNSAAAPAQSPNSGQAQGQGNKPANPLEGVISDVFNKKKKKEQPPPPPPKL